MAAADWQTWQKCLTEMIDDGFVKWWLRSCLDRLLSFLCFGTFTSNLNNNVQQPTENTFTFGPGSSKRPTTNIQTTIMIIFIKILLPVLSLSSSLSSPFDVMHLQSLHVL